MNRLMSPLEGLDTSPKYSPRSTRCSKYIKVELSPYLARKTQVGPFFIEGL